MQASNRAPAALCTLVIRSGHRTNRPFIACCAIAWVLHFVGVAVAQPAATSEESPATGATTLAENAADAPRAGAEASTVLAFPGGPPLPKDLTPRMATFLALAAAGDAGAGRSLGVELGRERRYTEALAWFEWAGESGDVEAMVFAAEHHFNGFGTNVDTGAGWRWTGRAASAGNLASKDAVGRLFLRTPRKEAQGVELLREAADAGHGPALVLLGRLHGDGSAAAWGLEQSPTLAAEHFRAAAVVHDPEGMARWAHCLETGTGVKPDLPESWRWYEAAAEAGVKLAMRTLARGYTRGHAAQGRDGWPEPDSKAAARWWQALAKVHDPEGMYEHAVRLLRAKASVDSQQAQALIERSAAAAYVPAVLHQAKAMRESGQSLEAIAKLLAFNEKHDSPLVHHALGNMLWFSPLGVKMSADHSLLAVDHWVEAAAAGHIDSMHRLAFEGERSLLGPLRDVQFRKAWRTRMVARPGESLESIPRFWLRRAVEAGDDFAARRLAEMDAEDDADSQ